MTDPKSDTLTIGVVGAGAMGQCIAQVALTGGLKAVLFDAKPGGGEAGRDQVFARLDRLVEKATIDRAEAAAMKQSLSLVDGLEGFAGCDAVIEAVFEDADLKRKIFADLEAVVSETARQQPPKLSIF